MLCPQCHSTFLKSSAFTAVKQTLSEAARRQWLEILQADSLSFQAISTPLCVEHHQPLVEGKLPDYGMQGYVANCCKLLHFPPTIFAPLLERSLTAPQHSIRDLKEKRQSYTVRVVRSILKALGKEEKPIDDGLDDILWQTKFLPLLQKK